MTMSKIGKMKAIHNFKQESAVAGRAVVTMSKEGDTSLYCTAGHVRGPICAREPVCYKRLKPRHSRCLRKRDI